MLFGVAVSSLVLTTCHLAVAQFNRGFVASYPPAPAPPQYSYAPAAPAAPPQYPGGECRTVTGNTCKLPFKFRGVKYNGCTFKDTEDGKAWCPTRLSDDGTAMPGSYENCDTALCYVNEPACRTNAGPDTGNTCKFPFTHNGVTYNSCANWLWGGQYDGKKWCSTQTNSFGNHISGRGFYGMCDCGKHCGCGGYSGYAGYSGGSRRGANAGVSP